MTNTVLQASTGWVLFAESGYRFGVLKEPGPDLKDKYAKLPNAIANMVLQVSTGDLLSNPETCGGGAGVVGDCQCWTDCSEGAHVKT